MFGYVVPDKPNMFVKDYTLYRAFYCGLCKSIGKNCSQMMRLSTNYDITFLSVLAHSVFDIEIDISNEVCILNPLKKKSIVKNNDLCDKIVGINTILAHYKCVDDILDNKSLGKKLIDKTIIGKHYRRAKKALPQIDKIVDDGYSKLRALEKQNCGVMEMVAEPFANIMRGIAVELFAEKYCAELGNIMYNLGKWVYFMDAIDDVDEDFKSKKYNMLLVDYKYSDKATFLADKRVDMEQILMACYDAISNNYEKLSIKKYEGVITNILWYGLLESTKDILRRTEKCKKTRI